MSTTVLCVAQIQSLASFVGLNVSAPDDLDMSMPYTICHGQIPAIDDVDGEPIPEHNGLIAYNEQPDGGVLAL